MNCSTPGFSVLYYLPEFAQTHVHWVSDAIQPPHPLLPASFSSCLQSFPASGSFPMSRLFASGGQSIGASASVIPVNIRGWFPLGLTDLISLLSKGLCLIRLLSSHTQFSKILSTSSSSPPSHSSTPSIPPPGVETILAYITSDQHFTKSCGWIFSRAHLTSLSLASQIPWNIHSPFSPWNCLLQYSHFSGSHLSHLFLLSPSITVSFFAQLSDTGTPQSSINNPQLILRWFSHKKKGRTSSKLMTLKFVLLARTSPRVSDPVLHLDGSQANPTKSVRSWCQVSPHPAAFPSDILLLWWWRWWKHRVV